jgi:hypothetical protein
MKSRYRLLFLSWISSFCPRRADPIAVFFATRQEGTSLLNDTTQAESLTDRR